jgi:hypothetical protein
LSRIARIPLFLTWKRDRTFSQAVAAEHATLLKTTFESWLAENRDAASAQSCQALYSSLSPSAQVRFLRVAATGVKCVAPDLSGENFTSNFFDQHLRAQLRRCLIDADGKRFDLGVLALGGVDERQIWVDAAGIYRLPGGAAFAPYTREDAHHAVSRLRRSLQLVGAVNKVAAKMIQDVIQVIILRQDTADPTGFSSSSWPGCAGLMALVNIQRRDLDNGWRVDALVHESVHSLLYMTECFEPFYSKETTPLAYRAVSPWSGRELNLHSYIHACFVWFALWCFWSLAATSKCFPPATIKFFQGRARHGFDTDLLSRLGPAQHEVAQSVRDVIGDMQKIVNEIQ